MREMVWRLLASALIPAFFAAGQTQARPRRLLIVSVDGLDWRYLRDRDKFGVKIPNMRRLLREGDSAYGVVGVWPTVTWPSHTSLITGARPDQHGIRGNRRPRSEGGDYYWNVDLLKTRTLWQAAHERGLTVGSVTWPVTVGASIDFNLPEFFLRRQGGSMDLEGVASRATPGLVQEIAQAFPSFPQQWVDDRTRTQAVRYLLKARHPDLILAHLVDLDSEEHDQGPFEKNSLAMLERSDELIGDMLRALPPEYDFALVSDHGFERVDKIANPRVLAARAGIRGDLQPMGGIVTTKDPAAASLLRAAAANPRNGIGREIPRQELLRHAPELAGVAAAWEPAPHVMFGPAEKGEYFTRPEEKGNHGFWPERADYRSVFVLSGPGVKAANEPSIPMTDIAARLSAVLGIRFP